MPDKLSIWNNALTVHLGERPLVTATEDREPARVFDQLWTGNAFLKEILEAGVWACATRTQELEADPSINPSFGNRFAFVKPSDYVQTAGIWSDEFMKCPLIDSDYNDEGGVITANIPVIYFSYVSSDVRYGLNLALWAPSMTLYAEGKLAQKGCLRITGDKSLLKDLEDNVVPKLLRTAKSKDSFKKPTKFMPQGSWTSARTSNFNRRSRSVTTGGGS